MKISNGVRIIGVAAVLAACALAIPAAGLARHAGTCTATTGSASGITSTSATLNGSNAGAGTHYFKWGLTTGYGNTTTGIPGGTGAYSTEITGLASSTTYHFRAACDIDGVDQSFTTSAAGSPAGSESADLGIVKTVTPPTVAVGSTATFKFVVTNVVGATALNAFVTDQLPAGLSLVTATSTQGSCSGTTLVTCTIGTLTSGQSVTVTVVVSAATAGTITNKADVGATNPDPNIGGNNHSSATLVVTGGAGTTTAPTTTSTPPTSTPRPSPPAPVVRVVSRRLSAEAISGTVDTRPAEARCEARVPVRLERVGTPNKLVASKRTGGNGSFSFARPTAAGAYRVVAPRVVVGGRTCLPATSAALRVNAG